MWRKRCFANTFVSSKRVRIFTSSKQPSIAITLRQILLYFASEYFYMRRSFSFFFLFWIFNFFFAIARWCYQRCRLCESESANNERKRQRLIFLSYVCIHAYTFFLYIFHVIFFTVGPSAVFIVLPFFLMLCRCCCVDGWTKYVYRRHLVLSDTRPRIIRVRFSGLREFCSFQIQDKRGWKVKHASSDFFLKLVFLVQAFCNLVGFYVTILWKRNFS